MSLLKKCVLFVSCCALLSAVAAPVLSCGRCGDKGKTHLID